MPRSGTTLVEQIISNHPAVQAGGELHFWNGRGSEWLQAGAPGSNTPFLTQAATDYLDMLRSFAPKAPRVTDKMPFNFLWAGLIHVTFPRAVILHCKRSAVEASVPARMAGAAVDPLHSCIQ